VDSGKKAMELLGLDNAQGKQRSVDMVLTDYCMPEMTGYDLLKAIKVCHHIRMQSYICSSEIRD
jgi:two-component response regulator (ARR-A family)